MKNNPKKKIVLPATSEEMVGKIMEAVFDNKKMSKKKKIQFFFSIQDMAENCIDELNKTKRG